MPLHPCHTTFISGGEASRSKHFTTQLSRDFIMQYNVQSSAVKGLRTEGDQVFVTFPNGIEYTYDAADANAFATSVSEAIVNQDSIGRLVNRAIQSKELVLAN